VKPEIHKERLDNGLTVLGEHMPSVRSAAFCLAIPAAAAYEPLDRRGLTELTVEMMTRGSGPRDSRQFIQDLNDIGAHRSVSVSDAYTLIWAATLDENILDALSIYVDMIRRPHLPEDQFEAGRLNVLYPVLSVDDEPDMKVSHELLKIALPQPWGLPSIGDEGGLRAATIDDVGGFFRNRFHAQGAVLAVTGRFDWDHVMKKIRGLLEDWEPGKNQQIDETPAKGGYLHVPHESNQTHVALSFPSISYIHDDYYTMWFASRVLGGGCSSRLFTEVREKRGLCYSVGTGYHSVWKYGAVANYAGTTEDRAQETLDVVAQEVKQLAGGVSADELDRVKAGAKSAIIKKQESSAMRAATLATDWFVKDKIITIDEMVDIVDNISAQGITEYLEKNPPADYSLVTLGNQPLEVPDGLGIS